MGGMDAPMVANMPADAMEAISSDQMGAMPADAQSAMQDMKPEDDGGIGAMDAALGGDMAADPAMDVNPADAALGQAMDSAMDQGGAPAAGGEQPMDSGMAEAIVDPAMDDGPKDDDQGGGLAG